MEFYRSIASPPVAPDLQGLLTIANLPALCASIDTVLEDRGGQGRIYCLWGSFQVNREIIRGGVRFTLPDCPNALAWTITCDDGTEEGVVLIHCTINRKTHEPDFIESIELFLDQWAEGLARALPA